jgi:hypothetical protein
MKILFWGILIASGLAGCTGTASDEREHAAPSGPPASGLFSRDLFVDGDDSIRDRYHDPDGSPSYYPKGSIDNSQQQQ